MEERERATNPKKDIISVSKEVDVNSMSKADKDAQTLAPALLRVTLRLLMVLVSALATSCTAFQHSFAVFMVDREHSDHLCKLQY